MAPESASATCPFIDRCPMFPVFRNQPIRRIYQIRYCEGDFSACQRYQQASKGKMPPPRLLPDGSWLPE